MSTLKTTGKPREFGTGAKRDAAKGKGRFDLLPMFGLYRVARRYEDGAVVYGDRNWEKGQPLSVLADSAMRHLAEHIAGFDNEDHLGAAIWNLLSMAEIEERIRRGLLPPELDDLPHTYAGEDPGF